MNWRSVCAPIVVVVVLAGCGQEENGGAGSDRSTVRQENAPSAKTQPATPAPEPPPPPESFGVHIIPVEEDGPPAQPVIWDDYNINNVPIAPGLKEVKAKYDIPDHPAVKALGHKAFHADPFYVERNSDDRETTPYSFRQFTTDRDIMSALNWYRSVAFQKPPKPGGSTLNGPFSDGCAATFNANNAYNYIVVSGIKHPQTGQVTVYVLHYTDPDKEPHPTLLDIPDEIRKHLVKLSATNWRKRERAAGSLAEMGKEVVTPLLRCLTVRDSNIRSGATRALAQIGKPAFGPMMENFEDADETYQQAALQVLASTEAELPKETADLVLPLLEGRTRHQAVPVLAKTGDSRAVDPLIECLEDENQHVRRAAAKALAQIGSNKAVQPLAELLADEKDLVRRTAIDALGQIGSPATFGPLNRCLKSEDKTLRKRAIRFVGKSGNEKAIPALQKIALNDNSQQAVRAISKIGGDKAVEALARCLKHDDQNMRMVTIEILGKLGGPKARAAIKTRLDDENEMIRRWAKMTLKKLENTENK